MRVKMSPPDLSTKKGKATFGGLMVLSIVLFATTSILGYGFLSGTFNPEQKYLSTVEQRTKELEERSTSGVNNPPANYDYPANVPTSSPSASTTWLLARTGETLTVEGNQFDPVSSSILSTAIGNKFQWLYGQKFWIVQSPDLPDAPDDITSFPDGDYLITSGFPTSHVLFTVTLSSHEITASDVMTSSAQDSEEFMVASGEDVYVPHISWLTGFAPYQPTPDVYSGLSDLLSRPESQGIIWVITDEPSVDPGTLIQLWPSYSPHIAIKVRSTPFTTDDDLVKESL